MGFKPGTTVIFVADPGTFSSTPEAAQYFKVWRAGQLPLAWTRISLHQLSMQDFVTIQVCLHDLTAHALLVSAPC